MPWIHLRRDGDQWRAELPHMPIWRSSAGSIMEVVAAARKVPDAAQGGVLTLKVLTDQVSGVTESFLTTDDFLELLEANGRPDGLDLSGCRLRGIDLSRDSLLQRLSGYQRAGHGLPSWWSTITGGINLRRAHFNNADLSRARLQGANLEYASLENTRLRSAHLEEAKLADARLCGADLTRARLDEADLARADIKGATLTRTHLTLVDLRQTHHLDQVRWYSTILDGTIMERKQLGETVLDHRNAQKYHTAGAYLMASQAYLTLKANFSTIGRYADASWAYVNEQSTRREMHFQSWSARSRQHPGLRLHERLESLGLWLRSLAYFVISGYGERPRHPLLVGLFVIVLYTGVYLRLGNVDPSFGISSMDSTQQEPPACLMRETTGQQRLTFWDATVYSVASFFTVGFNTMEPCTLPARLLTASESAIGIGLFAVFVFTLGNRISRS